MTAPASERELGPATAYVALGSNLGPRALILGAALARLEATPGVLVTARSRWYETEPVGGPAGQRAFLNGVCRLWSRLPARALLERCLAIEAELGRDRSRGLANAPRTLDLDLLLVGALAIDEPDLRLPHPRLEQRAFVIEPLAELAPELVLASGRTVRELCESFGAAQRGRPVDGELGLEELAGISAHEGPRHA